jgi:hypothetical protein
VKLKHERNHDYYKQAVHIEKESKTHHSYVTVPAIIVLLWFSRNIDPSTESY